MERRLDEKTLGELRETHRRTRDRRGADRIKAVYLLGLGWSAQAVAVAVMLDEKTVAEVFRKFEVGGIDAIFCTAYTGKAPLLNAEQQAELAAWLDENLCMTTAEIAAHVAKNTASHFPAAD